MQNPRQQSRKRQKRADAKHWLAPVAFSQHPVDRRSDATKSEIQTVKQPTDQSDPIWQQVHRIDQDGLAMIRFIITVSTPVQKRSA